MDAILDLDVEALVTFGAMPNFRIEILERYRNRWCPFYTKRDETQFDIYKQILAASGDVEGRSRPEVD